jgi:hypothetical protein
MSVPQVPLALGVSALGRNVWEKVPQVPLCLRNHDPP